MVDETMTLREKERLLRRIVAQRIEVLLQQIKIFKEAMLARTKSGKKQIKKAKNGKSLYAFCKRQNHKIISCANHLITKDFIRSKILPSVRLLSVP